jgi:aryl-alcohol dehydrogenase-like predicted oxidoreductase
MTALRFCIENPLIAATLIGMATREEVEQNLEALLHAIDLPFREEIASIAETVAGMVWASRRPENQEFMGAAA